MKRYLAIFCFLIWALVLSASGSVWKCDICGQIIQKKFYKYDDQGVGGKKVVCESCAALKEECFICRLPVKAGYTTLPDGRIVCARDAMQMVATEEEGKQLGINVKDDLDRLLWRYMTYPGNNVLISIVDRFYLEHLMQSPTAGQACATLYGVTCGNPVAGNKLMHTVAVLSNLPKTRTMAVFAHEFTHAWMYENVNARPVHLDKDTVEGFCELIAYKYMKSRNEAFEMENIRKNNYTKGKVDVLIAADEKYGFDAVMEWIKSGDNDTFTLDTLERVRAVSGRYVAASAGPVLINGPVAAQVAPAPDKLVLKGISGSGAHRFALINSATLEPMERAKIHLAQTNIVVQCLEIHDKSVTIQIEGTNEKKQLFLKED